jgi:predicted secreted protein
MGSQALTSFGVSLLRGVTPIAEITSLTPPTFNSETIDVTNHDSVGRMAEFIGGMRSSDDVKITCNYIANDPGQALLLADQADGLVHAYTLVFPTAWGCSFSFSVVVLKCGISPFTAKGDAVQLETTMKVSGAVTLNQTLSDGMTVMTFNAAGVTAPTVAVGTYEYVNTQLTGATSVTVAVTATGVITLTTPVGTQVLTSTVASSAIALGAAGTITDLSISVKETGHVARVYTVHVLRPAAE